MLKGANRSYWRARDQVHVSDENGRAIMTIARWPNVVLGPLGERMAKFLENYPKADEIYITSGRDGDHGDVSHHYGLSYGGSPTAAIDIGAGGVGVGDVKMRDFAEWLYDNYADFTVELIHSTPFADDHGFYVKNQKRNPGGSVYGGQGSSGISITSTGRRRRR
jgi:hypothetical protein